jgi:hypothetical protein
MVSEMALELLELLRLSPLIIILIYLPVNILLRSLRRDSSVGIETSYGPDDRGVGVQDPVVSRIFSSPNGPDRL